MKKIFILCITLLIVINFTSCIMPNQRKISYEIIQAIENENKVEFDRLINKYPHCINVSAKSDIDVLFSDSGSETPLHAACRKQIYYYVNQLVNRGADVNYSPYAVGYPPIYIAVSYYHNDPLRKNENIEIVKLLLKEGADVNFIGPNNRTLLIEHIAYDIDYNLELINLLIEYDIDLTIKDYKGKTAYDYAIENGNYKLAELLKP